MQVVDAPLLDLCSAVRMVDVVVRALHGEGSPLGLFVQHLVLSTACASGWLMPRNRGSRGGQGALKGSVQSRGLVLVRWCSMLEEEDREKTARL